MTETVKENLSRCVINFFAWRFDDPKVIGSSIMRRLKERAIYNRPRL